MLTSPAVRAAAPAEAFRPRRALAARGWRMIWAVADQAFFAGSTFVATVLLARWLSAQAFGAFAVASAVLTLLVLLQTATVIEPMLIGGGGEDREAFRGYLGTTMVLNGAASLAVAALLGAVALGALALGRVPLAAAIVGLAVCVPGSLMLILARRATYVLGREVWAVAGGVANLGLMVAGMALLQRAGLLTVFSALAVTGAAALAVSIVLLALLGPARGSLDRGGLREVARRHAAYARWAVPSHVLNWLPNNVFYIVLAPLAGLQAAAAFRVVSNLVLPVRHVLSAAAVSLLARLSEVRRRQGEHAFEAQLNRYLLMGAGLTAVYFAATWVAFDPVTRWLYGGRYTGLGRAGVILAVGPMFNVIAVGYVNALKIQNRLRTVFLSYLVAGVATVLVGLPLVRFYGVEGASAAVTLAGAAGAASSFLLFRRRRPPAGEPRGSEEPAAPRSHGEAADAQAEGETGPRVLMLHGINLFNAGDHGIALAIIHRIREVLPGVRLRVASPFLAAQQARREFHDAVRRGSPIPYPPELPDLYQLPVGGRRTRGHLLQGLSSLLTWALVLVLPRPLSRRIAPGRRFIRLVEESDVVVSKGGGFLLDRGTSYPVPIHLVPIAIAVRLGTPVVIYAQTVGPFDRRFARWVARAVLRRVALVLVRDEYSMDYVTRVLKVPAGRVHLTGDEAFRLASLAGRDPEPPRPGQAGGEYSVGFTLVAPRSGGFPGERAHDAYLRAVSSTVERLCAAGADGPRVREVTFIPHLESGALSDRLLAGEVRRRVGEAGRVRVLDPSHPLEIIRAMREMDVMVCTRMHSVIFAIVAGVPFVAISYLPKTDSLLERLGLAQWSIPLAELLERPDESAERLCRMARELAEEGEPARARVAAARERAFESAGLNGQAVAALLAPARAAGA